MSTDALAWTEHAACVGRDPEMWFPHSGGDTVPTEAKRICARCEVRAECLALAMRAERGRGHASRFGIFGGLGPVQRYELDPRSRRRRRRAS